MQRESEMILALLDELNQSHEKNASTDARSPVRHSSQFAAVVEHAKPASSKSR